ncbi:hypothetical protein BDF19DRAFT_436382 [Syncephalis fuscata]|nr:hypothetical protein BDF19DRAFT_436382 [Syncephalis fuscata]
MKLLIPCKRQFLSRVQAKTTSIPCQNNSSTSPHHHHYQQHATPHHVHKLHHHPRSIVELLRGPAHQTRCISSHAFGYHPGFGQWQHRMMAGMLRSALLGPQQHSLLRVRLVALANLFSQTHQNAVRDNARQFWIKAQHHGCIDKTIFRSPFGAAYKRNTCILSRLAEMRQAAMTTGVPRGYATAVARCQAMPQPAKAAFFAGRLFATPFASVNAKGLSSSKNEEQDCDSQDQLRFRRRFIRTVRPKRSQRFAGAAMENNRVADVAIRPKSIHYAVDPVADEKVAATLIVDLNVHTNEAQQLNEEIMQTVENVAAVADSYTEEAQTQLLMPPTLHQNLNIFTAWPPLYDYLMLDNGSGTGSNGSNGSVVDESFMRRLTEVMGLNRRQLELVSQALSLLRERIPRLDVRLEGYEVRVFMPLGTPVATVRHWLYEAGLREGKQYIFESISSLRAAAATQHGSSRMSHGSSPRSLSPPTSQPSFASTSTKAAGNPARDIHSFLAQADSMAQDTTAFSKQPANTRQRCTPSVRLAAARSYSVAMNYVF